MNDKNKNILTDTDYLTVDVTAFGVSNVYTISATYTNGYTLNDIITVDTSNTELTYDDPYEQLEKLTLEKEEDERLRNEHPVLQEAYDHYHLIKKLVEDSEFDDSFEERYRGFKQ